MFSCINKHTPSKRVFIHLSAIIKSDTDDQEWVDIDWLYRAITYWSSLYLIIVPLLTKDNRFILESSFILIDSVKHSAGCRCGVVRVGVAFIIGLHLKATVMKLVLLPADFSSCYTQGVLMRCVSTGGLQAQDWETRTLCVHFSISHKRLVMCVNVGKHHIMHSVR